MAIYVAQFGGFWRLTDEQWKAVVHDALHGDGYILPGAAQLRGQPGHVRRTMTSDDRQRFISADPKHKLYQPLDWSREDWKTAAEELKEPIGNL